MLKPLQIIILLVFFRFSVFAQPAEKKTTPEQYINNFKEEAIKEMLMFGIPASITLAQGMLESANGNSDLAVYANNHFGIKCHDEWDGPIFTKDDDAKDECFRKYPSVLDSYTDHSKFLKSRSRYDVLFRLKHSDYKGWAKGLKELGYATDPRYTQRIINLIETHKLYQYDKVDGLPNITASVVEKQSAPKIIQSREILRTRFIKYIIVRPGDNFGKIAEDTDKDLWQLYKFNDLKPTDKLVAGQKIYLQPKRRKAEDPFHIVKKGETMKFISQLYGIKLKSLYSKNNMKPGEEPIIGQQLYMR
ncbi:MAG: glucosaminidase domain-containing protein, partial [Bacteroidetes bacterium]|nr:glucosaminidase domain-containing protein [Bacteroidota bacterium]